MFASSFPRNRNQRRGVVLVLVLGMLGLLALIGVTFATFSGQVKVNSKNFSQAQNWPESAELMDYALSQLIDDTDNPMSAIRGHSLKRDMYGNDALYNAALTAIPSTGTPFQIVSITPVATGSSPVRIIDVDGTSRLVAIEGLIAVQTNIAWNEPSLYGYNFTRWIMRFPQFTEISTAPATQPNAFYPSETHEILADFVPTSGNRIFYVARDDNSQWGAVIDMLPAPNLETPANFTGANYSLAPTIPYPLPNYYSTTSYQPSQAASPDPTKPPIQNYSFYNFDYVTNIWQSNSPGRSRLVGLENRFALGSSASNFVLDGRFLNAFNGPGMSALDPVLQGNTHVDNTFNLRNRGMAQYANFRVNGNILTGNIASGDTNAANNFQTAWAYGSPNLCGMDEDYDACDLENWFLALQSGDSQVMVPSFHRPGILIYDPSQRDPKTGNGIYNDWTSQNPFSAAKILRPRSADGHNALAFPDLVSKSDGTIDYDVDNDGDGISDSVWLDLGYPARRNNDGRLFKPLYAFMIIGLNGRIPLNTAGNLQLRSLFDPATSNYGTSLFEHASNKGYSPSEIDPTYALQNAFDEDVTRPHLYSPVDNAGATSGGTYNETTHAFVAGDGTQGDPTTYTSAPWWGTAGIPVSTTQLRNILAGTRAPEPYTDPMLGLVPTNGDANFVVVNGQKMYLPNGLIDEGDRIVSQTVTTNTRPVEGRWGEGALQPVLFNGTVSPSAVASLVPFAPPFQARPPRYYYLNEVRAGYSGQPLGIPNVPAAADARDDNYNTLDWYPRWYAKSPGDVQPTQTVPNPLISPNPYLITSAGENADFLDPSGSVSLAVERFRRFVTPINVAGDGFVNRFVGSVPSTSAALMPVPVPTVLLGADPHGRVAFVKHHRPHGVLQATPPGLELPGGLGAAVWDSKATAPALTNWIWYPYQANSKWLNAVGQPVPPLNTSTTPLQSADLTTNPLYGYEAYRSPVSVDNDGANVVTLVPNGLLGGMPRNNIPTEAGKWTPTFDQYANSTDASALLNEADEMNPYVSQAHDHAYGFTDLEWLYRYQDVDGVSLSSRLKDLAPVSFTNPQDGTRRRRMFSVDTWEPTTFVWAHDNPANDLQWPLVTADPLSAPYGNSWFFASNSVPNRTDMMYSNQSMNLSTLSYLLTTQHGIYEPADTTTPPNYTIPRRLPSIAHRNRKINLNFPLPVSNRYDEPVRQKWIRETYQLLKSILPPKAIDTPEELAQLSQFVVNIVDFRDPDGTATRFVNTDIYYAAPASATSPAKVAFTPTDPTVRRALLGEPWKTNVSSDVPPDFSPIYDNSNSPYIVQYGMEYNPIAITEVLAFKYYYDDGTGSAAATPAKKMWIELVNTLTQPQEHQTANDLKLPGWDIVITKDDYEGRPDPITGQLPITVLAGADTSRKGLTLSNKDIASLALTDNLEMSKPIKAINPSTNSRSGTDEDYFVIEDSATTMGEEEDAPSSDIKLDLINGTKLSDDTDTVDRFYWLYLRRPANPFDMGYDPSRPNENRVVVDCFRFSMNMARPTGLSSGSPTPNAQRGDLYSTQRLQPYRGGHAVSPLLNGNDPDVPAYGVPNYGYSEQVGPATDDDDDDYYVKPRAGSSNNATGMIYESLGKRPDHKDYAWDYFQFNNRDFTSVAELLMVPGCPPGLFTKQFTEFTPPITQLENPRFKPPGTTVAEADRKKPIAYSRPTAPPKSVNRTKDTENDRSSSQPHMFPYLVDKFFYTGVSEPTLALLQNTTPASGPAPIHDYLMPPVTTTNFTGRFPFPDPTTFTVNNPALPSVPNYIGGPSSDGWFRMFEFFDVPSPANGSISTVAQGMNYDWARQDLKPGLLNINLIADEEVFFSIMSETWLKTLDSIRNVVTTGGSIPYAPGKDDFENMGNTRLNVTQVADANTPVVVTSVRANGLPYSTYQMKNQGFMAIDPTRSEAAGSTGFFYGNKMKSAFSDFLKLRHGGSGYMFAHQSGDVGNPTYPAVTSGTTVIASERPFHSFSYPDINYTLMRPAGLPPSLSTTFKPFNVYAAPHKTVAPFQLTWGEFTGKVNQLGVVTPDFYGYVGDPGVKNHYLFMQNNPVQPPPIPPRRLFELPDVWGSVTEGFPTGPGTDSPTILSSNASPWPYLFPPAGTTYFTGDPNINWVNQILTSEPYRSLVNLNGDLSAVPNSRNPAVTPPNYAAVPWFYLGSNTNASDNKVDDNRQHPSFRYDWLHKVTNLTTVRTHQYAVWITVGFFEVTKQGDPMVGNVQPGLAYDRLGQELNVQNGKNIRYRSFFVIDRTRAVGFSPQAPGNFRECIVYRQPIE